MSDRIQYHVVPMKEDWAVETEGALTLFDTKAKAEEAAIKLARENWEKGQTAQVLIHRANGTIEDERTYGEDPYPPKG